MLATFIIGLREGLEAALIVGIIAAFLRNNGKSLAAMWAGVALAVVLSVLVGGGLALVEQALPQAEQEALETVIGAVAIVFVTGMISWMHAHARDMKRALEAQAAAALGRTGATALAGMAFLAVLKEGFETAVFLLATFSAAQSAGLAATGAMLGLLCAVLVGWGIYAGGVRFNLGRFFSVTGGFLILVAAGLVISALRTAHEAGWISAGQQATISLAWLVRPGTVRSALITGVLGIPADPRLVEAVGWVAYLVPVACFIYWPQAHRPSRRTARRLQLATCGGLLIVAAGLALGVPAPSLRLPSAVPLVTTAGASAAGTARLVAGNGTTPPTLTLVLDGGVRLDLPLSPSAAQDDWHDGMAARTWRFERSEATTGSFRTLTLDQVVALSGGRLPVGMNAERHPGPFAAEWQTRHALAVWTAAGALLDVAGQNSTTVTISAGGLATPRVLRAGSSDPARSGEWRMAEAFRASAVAALNDLSAARSERTLWARQVPALLLLAAGLLGLLVLRDVVRRRPAVSPSSRPRPGNPAARDPQGDIHAAE